MTPPMRKRGLRMLVPGAGLLVAGILCQSPAHAGAETLSPRDAGARYGQALGALEICYGSRLTAAGDALRSRFSGADNDVFKAQAAKIFNAWHTVKNCANADDPNQCKIIMDKSCAAAEAEIGTHGSVMPGLVEFATR